MAYHDRLFLRPCSEGPGQILCTNFQVCIPIRLHVVTLQNPYIAAISSEFIQCSASAHVAAPSVDWWRRRSLSPPVAPPNAMWCL